MAAAEAAPPTSNDHSSEDRLAYASSQETTLGTGVSDFIIPDLEGLTEQQALPTEVLVFQGKTVSARGEGDLGCANLITHEIPLQDEVAVQLPYRQNHPSQR